MKSTNDTPETEFASNADNVLTGPRYWRSLDDLVETPSFRDWMEREFPQGASELEGVNRRGFLKLMAASFALAGFGAAGCRRPVSQIRPYGRESDRQKPGLPVHYATSLPSGTDNIPLVVETHMGRPTKIEGNEKFKANGGSTDLLTQGSILDLYDPDRAKHSSRGSQTLLREQVVDLLGELRASFRAVQGQGLAVLATPSTSPTRARMVAELRERFPRLLWAEYEPISTRNADIGIQELFDLPLRVQVDYARARRILSLDCDFMHCEPGKLANSRGFSKGRKVRNSGEASQMSRLYQVESVLSSTGLMADHRLRLPTTQIAAFAARVAAEVFHRQKMEPELAADLLRRSEGVTIPANWIEACVEDLLEHQGESVVVAGSHLPPEVHQLVAYINEALGANGQTVRYLEIPEHRGATIGDLATALRNGEVDTLLVLGGNPAYDAPSDINWQEAVGRAKRVIRHGYYFDETSLGAEAHIAGTHFLESWGDGRTADGTYVPVQPMILPLFDGMSELEVLAYLGGAERIDPYSWVADTFRLLAGGNDSESPVAFERFLATGFLPESGYSVFSGRFSELRASRLVAQGRFEPSAVNASSLEVRVVPDASVWDGRYCNNGWLQECPDPISKLTWDNAILISPTLASDLGFDTKTGEFLIGSGVSRKSANFKRGREMAPVAELELDGVSVRGPVHIQPGLPDYTVVLTLGYGRRKVGRVGRGTGFDAYPLFRSAGPGATAGAKIRLDPDAVYPLANAQEHWSMEGRAIIREANVGHYEDDPAFASKMGMEAHSPPIYGKDATKPLAYKVTEQPRGGSAFKTPEFTAPQQWGMSIDLNLCNGCNACVVACQNENNIPIVGKDQVMRGREMHWIRIDRYYSSGDLETNRETVPSEPQVSLMPMLCQHCDRAPCEQVCPVNATVQDNQGLNVMAYNRCVGTRYCANNCPYKVRRFNFFDWNKREIGEYYKGVLGTNRYDQGEDSELQRMRANPEVTVRMRGVMEKCTFCVQRIERAKIAQKTKTGLIDGGSDDIKVPDGVIKTACQQVCPTSAIVFGDVADPETEVSREKSSDRDYMVLGYLNTRPRTTYLARLRNPNVHMPDYKNMPLSQIEYNQTAGHSQDHGHDGPHEHEHDHAHGG